MTAEPLIEARTLDPKMKKGLLDSVHKNQNIKDIDDLITRGAKNHKELSDTITEIANEIGATPKIAPLKERARIEEKVRDKYRGDLNQIGDVARGGIDALNPKQADEFVDRIAQKYKIIDEGYATTDLGYFDRKLVVVFDDGAVGEVQIWSPGMADAKFLKGDNLYRTYRDKTQPITVRRRAKKESKRLYNEILDKLDKSWLEELQFSRFNKTTKDASDTFGSGTKTITYEEPISGSTLVYVDRSGIDEISSIIELNVPEKFRGRGIGKELVDRVMEDTNKVQGQISSKAAAKNAYDAGRRLVDDPDASLEQIFRRIDELSSVNLASPAAIKKLDQKGIAPPASSMNDLKSSADISGDLGSPSTSPEAISPKSSVVGEKESILPGSGSYAGILPSTKKNLIDTSYTNIDADDPLIKGIDDLDPDLELPFSFMDKMGNESFIPQSVKSLKQEIETDKNIINRLDYCTV